MHILALNPGSSTLKYRLFNVQFPQGTAEEQLRGTVEHPGGEAVAQATEQTIGQCQALGVDAVGFRVVHGGSRFVQPTRITPEVRSELAAVSELAPLHNPIALVAMDTVARLLPEVPVVAVFDTSFHRTLPQVARLYALPSWVSEKGLCRYGFHGISHEHVSRELLQRVKSSASHSRMVTCHLGNGASICAVRDGQSVDTSMGLTPLEGLVMGTRSGDVDPGLVLHLVKIGMSAEQVDDLLNHQAGMLGLSGRSGDVRELLEAQARGDAHAGLALNMFGYRVRKYIGAYAAVLSGLDAVAFTGGIGEHSPSMRARICQGLEFLGLQIDPARNQQTTGKDAERISAEGSEVEVWVIPTDEEREIAWATARVVPRTQHRTVAPGAPAQRGNAEGGV